MELLFGFWYVACPSAEIARGKMQTKMLLGQQILFGRTTEGEVFALRDFCPHRGVPLSYGKFDGVEIECCYHGWCFNKSGACTKIPSLTPEDTVDISRIKAQSYPCREEKGLIWVYISAPKMRLPETLPALPELPAADVITEFYHVESVELPCNIDHAVIGLMDPAHGPFVHASWWWRSKRSMHIKAKKFAPTPLGFKMMSHKPSSNSRAYKILGGGERKTEIAFMLPSYRTEHITVGNHHIVLLTALTPIDETRTMLHQFIFTTIGAINLLLPILKPFGKAFIKQDIGMVKKQENW
jgi:phenylpropionate dioxygenase-like ring-hydroxylating dioxygenase large terminal subunit